jgi:MarR family transcriptional regulator, organic hydroperoxide resistance regulator
MDPETDPVQYPPHAALRGVDELSSRVFRAFVTALRLHKQQMMRALATRGIHPGQAFCLRVVAERDGTSQRDLADALHLARPTVTKMLQSLERSGAVERRPDADDQRLTRVYLTDAGRALADEMHGVAADYVNATIGSLPEVDRRDLARLLEELIANIERATSESAT